MEIRERTMAVCWRCQKEIPKRTGQHKTIWVTGRALKWYMAVRGKKTDVALILSKKKKRATIYILKRYVIIGI